MSDRGTGKGLFIGFLLGGIAGSIAALLYAPKSGQELRGDIRRKSEEFADDAENYLEQARSKANQLINEGKKRSEKLVEDAKVKVDALLGEAEKVLLQAKDRTSKAVEEGKSKVTKESDKLKSAIKSGINTYKTDKDA